MGAPRKALMPSQFILLSMDLVDLLEKDIEAALIFQRIAWRCERTGTWVASRQVIMDETRVSEFKVRQALAKLCSLGWLSWERAGAFDATPRWTVHVDDEAPARSDGHLPMGGEVTTPSDRMATLRSSSQDDETKDEDKNTSPAAPVVLVQEPLVAVDQDAAVADEFGEFWRVYPRKTGKGTARTAYWKAVGKVGSLKVLTAAQAFAQHVQAQRIATTYVPHPTTWLNGERWDDELVVDAAAARTARMAGDVSQDGSWARSGNGGW